MWQGHPYENLRPRYTHKKELLPEMRVIEMPYLERLVREALLKTVQENRFSPHRLNAISMPGINGEFVKLGDVAEKYLDFDQPFHHKRLEAREKKK